MGSGVRTPSSSSYSGKERKGVDGTCRSGSLTGVAGCTGCTICCGDDAPSGISPPVSTTARIGGKPGLERVEIGRNEKGAVQMKRVMVNIHSTSSMESTHHLNRLISPLESNLHLPVLPVEVARFWGDHQSSSMGHP